MSEKQNTASDQLSEDVRQELIRAQRGEITEYHLYHKLARRLKGENADILKRIAEDELRHYKMWKHYTGENVRPDMLFIFRFYWITRLLGLTFGIKLMEKGESRAQDGYRKLIEAIPEAEQIVNEEHDHENELIGMIQEEKLEYVGSIVLGLNDALVELTGALAGFTFALAETRLIAVAGLITGIAASFSMAASEYLSSKSEGEPTAKAFKSSVYTGLAYIITVILLILPYLLLENLFACLGVTLSIAVVIILVFNYYISVAKELPFKKRFLEMAGISLGVSALSFGIGFFIRNIGL